MKQSLQTITFLVSLLLLSCFHAHAQFVYNWAKGAGGTNFDEGNALAFDSSHNVYVTGDYQGSNVNFGNAQHISSAGGQDIFFAKYDSVGNCLWAKSIGGATDDVGEGIAVDKEGNVFICGHFTSTAADFDPGTGSATLTTNGNWTIFLAKYDKNGNYQWAFKIPNPGGPCSAHGLAIDANSNVIMTGYFQLTCNFNPNGTANLTTNGGYSIFFAKYSNSGNYLWAKNFGSAGIGTIQEANAIALDKQGSIFLTGYFTGTTNLNPAGVHNITSNGTQDIFIAKYDSSGIFQWGGGMGSTSAYNELGKSLCTDLSGNVYLTGSFCGATDFDISSSGTNNVTPIAAGDIFVVKYDKNGALKWVNDIGSCGGIQGNGIATLGRSVYVTGYYQCTPDFDPDVNNSVTPTWYGNYDIFLTSYTADSGKFVSLASFGSTNADEGNAVVVNPVDSSVFLTGYFTNTVCFDPLVVAASLTSASSSEDFFLAKYNMHTTPSGIESIDVGNEFSISPNPVHDELNIYFYTEKEQEVQFVIHSIDGRNIYEFTSHKSIGNNHIIIPATVLCKGIYFISFTDGEIVYNKKFIVD
jgi:hypothetical protein